MICLLEVTLVALLANVVFVGIDPLHYLGSGLCSCIEWLRNCSSMLAGGWIGKVLVDYWYQTGYHPVEVWLGAWWIVGCFWGAFAVLLVTGLIQDRLSTAVADF